MIYCIKTMQMKKRFRGLLNLGFLTQLGADKNSIKGENKKELSGV